MKPENGYLKETLEDITSKLRASEATVSTLERDLVRTKAMCDALREQIADKDKVSP
jgi:hypothetical protein